MTFSKEELDILGEVGNMAVGGAASRLSDFLERYVTITTPRAERMSFQELNTKFLPRLVVTKIDFKEEFQGSNFMLMEEKKALEFVQIIAREKVGQMIHGWDSFAIETLSEIFNIMVAHMSTTMSELFHKFVSIEAPHVYVTDVKGFSEMKNEEDLIAIWFELSIEQEFNFQIIKLIDTKQAQKMVDILKGEQMYGEATQ